jgi:hypothetical protein
MKNRRLSLLLTELEKERIEQQAAALGTSPSDYMRRAVALLDADDISVLEEIRSLLPQFDAALTRIHDNLTAAADRREKRLEEIARMQTPEYREEVRRSIMADEAGLEAMAALVRTASPERAPSETESPRRGTLAERTGKFAKARSQVNEAREPWGEDDTLGEGKSST